MTDTPLPAYLAEAAANPVAVDDAMLREILAEAIEAKAGKGDPYALLVRHASSARINTNTCLDAMRELATRLRADRAAVIEECARKCVAIADEYHRLAEEQGKVVADIRRENRQDDDPEMEALQVASNTLFRLTGLRDIAERCASSIRALAALPVPAAEGK